MTTSLATLLRKRWIVALLIAILATETLLLAIVLFEIANKGSQSFPSIAQVANVGWILLGF